MCAGFFCCPEIPAFLLLWLSSYQVAVAQDCPSSGGRPAYAGLPGGQLIQKVPKE